MNDRPPPNSIKTNFLQHMFHSKPKVLRTLQSFYQIKIMNFLVQLNEAKTFLLLPNEPKWTRMNSQNTNFIILLQLKEKPTS